MCERERERERERKKEKKKRRRDTRLDKEREKHLISPLIITDGLCLTLDNWGKGRKEKKRRWLGG